MDNWKIKNTFKFNGTELLWDSGEVKDAKYNEFLEQSKKTKFKSGIGLIGRVFESGKEESIDVTTLPGDKYLRLEAAKKAGVGPCCAKKDGDKVHEVFT